MYRKCCIVLLIKLLRLNWQIAIVYCVVSLTASEEWQGISNTFHAVLTAWDRKIMKWLVMCYMTLYICGFYFCVVNSSSSLIPLRSKPTASALPINHVQNYRYLLWSKQKNTPVHKQFYTFHFVQFGDLWFQFIPQSLNFNIQCLLICSMHVNRSRQCIGLLLHVCECDIHYAHDHLPPVSWYKLVCPS